MIQGKILTYGDDLTPIYDIRKKVFVEELGIPKDKAFDEQDPMAMHVLVFEENPDQDNAMNNKIPVATGRITYDGTDCVIEHIAVLKKYRNKEYGDFTLRMLVNRALIAGVKEISLLSPTNLCHFFENVGFEKNEEQNDNEVSHMSLKLSNLVTMCKGKH